MNENKLFETVGTISKKETLASIEYDTDKALVLETLKPYPGYHGTTIPDQLNPISLFLVTGKKYSGEKVIRATMAVKQKFESNFDATPGEITVFNTLTPCIRIKDLESYNEIENLIKHYRENGIDFLKDKKIDPFSSLIKIRKYFTLEKVEEGLYIDKDIREMTYFEVPKQLDWDVFERMTLGMKQNVDFNNFDAALGVFFPPNIVIDTVRIYHDNADIADIKYLRNKYLEEIGRLP
nr:hypothetical protein [Bacteroidota bacterium]